jgi:dTDP-4-amino-4,6-dideoxygalactose transaminase
MSMREIKMVELRDQYLRFKSEVDEAMAEVLDSTQFIRGSHVKSFQKNLEEYLNVKHVLGCGNGTDALQIALMALNLKPGDEVLTPSFSFIAAAEVIALLGFKPVLLDVDRDTYNMDVEDLKRKIGPNSKVIIPVHLFGQCSNMEAIMEIADENELFVIEDNAQAIGADYIFSDGSRKKSGTIGHIATTSFFPSKNLGCYGDGGAIFTNNDAIAQRIAMITNHGSQVKYYHEVVGVNSRLDTLQAAVLDVKLKHLDDFSTKRQAVADFYDQALANVPGVQTPKRSAFSEHVFHQYTMIVEEDRDELRAFLAERSIPSMIYYPVPLHRQEAYAEFILDKESCPVSDELASKVLSLPISTEMDQEQLNYIVQGIIEFKKSKQHIEIN